MKRLAFLVALVLAAPTSGIAASPDPRLIEWVDPGLLRQAMADPSGEITVVLGFRDVPDLEPLRAQGFAIMGYEHLPVAVALVQGRDVPRLLSQPGVLSATRDIELEHYVWPTARAGNFGGTGDELTRSDRARALGVDGSGVGVAVIDLGTSGLHPGLRPRAQGGPMVQNVKILVSPGKILASQPAQSPTTLYLEDLVNSDLTDGHGTHTAGIAAGHWTEDGLLGGRAPGADLVAIGAGDALALPWVLGGLEYVAANHERYNIRVVTNSWGVQGPYNPVHPVNLATKALADEGLLVLFSAGNAGPGLRTMNAYSLAPHVLAIGATTLSGAIASFSSRGDPASGKPGPDLVAPGANIISGRNQWVSANEVTYRTPWNDAGYVPLEHLNWYRAVSGTSMAAPQVAGIAALIWQANPSLTAADVSRILIDTARPIVGFQQTAQGAGLVDAHAAVLAARGETIPEPSFVEPTVVDRAGDAVVYPFHGAILGGPDKSSSAFRHQAPFPLYLPSRGATIDVSWRPVGPTSGLKVSLIGPDGSLVRVVPLDQAGTSARITLSAEEIADHKEPYWSAGYWNAIIDLDVGAVEWDVVVTASYEDGVLPAVTHAPPPPPPPPAARIARGPIVIASDADFTAANGVTRGSGTAADPYVIEGWDIDPAAGPGISVGGTLGTSAHLVIRDVRVHDTGGNCIDFVRVANVTVRDSAFDGCNFALNFRGGSNLVVERNLFQATKFGPAFYGASNVIIRGNLLQSMETSGIIVGQGFTQQSTFSLNAVIEDNVLLGAKTDIFVSSPAAVSVRVHRNALGEGAFVNLQIAPMLTEVSDTLWLDGVPRIISAILSAPHDDLPTSTIVDAGSDRPSGQRVCFDDARAEVAGATVTSIAWDFGDGSASNDFAACHDYGPGSYVARLTVTIALPDGSSKALGDSVLVG